MKRSIKKSLVVLSMLLTVAGSAHALDIQGRLLNGTTGAPGAAQTVTLLLLRGGMQEVATLRDVQDTFSFSVQAAEDPMDNGPYLIRATYAGVNYFKAIGPFQLQTQATHEIVVYERTEDLGKAKVTLPHLFIKRNQDKLLLVWNYELHNHSDRTMHREGGLFRVALPKAFESLDVSASRGTMPIKVSLTPAESGEGFFVNYPLRPGRNSFQIACAVDYASEQYALELPIFYDVGKVLAVFHPEDMQVVSPGLVDISTDPQQHVRIAAWEGVAAGQSLAIEMRGGSLLSSAKGHAHKDNPVVTKPPRIAEMAWVVWLLMGLGLGMNVLFALRRPLQ